MDQPIVLSIAPLRDWRGDLMITFSPAAEKPTLTSAGKEAGDIRLAETGKGEAGSPRSQAVASLGPVSKINAEIIRRVGASIFRWLVKNNVADAGLDLTGLQGLGIEDPLTPLAEGLLLGSFRFDQHKSAQVENPAIRVALLADQPSAALQDRLNDVVTLAEAVNLAREWAHEPPNIINPVTLAERAAVFAAQNQLKCTILDDRMLSEMGAGAILAVGKGSSAPSRMIVLEYPGKNATLQSQPVVVVGKAITFDTGGYSLKDRQNMVGMKYDKSGGMAVLGILQAASRLGVKTPVVGIIAAAENMISGDAYRPNDIIKTLSGKTVEIISSDAEGRMVLSDALTYAQNTYKPRAIIDLATLTGGVVVALGHIRAGILSNNDALADALIASGERTHELLWRLPLDEEYFELIKGDDSDFKNSGPREAHPIIGGIFLKQFVSDQIPWAHLDIAGTADTEKDLPYSPKGATGYGIRLIIDYLQHLES